MNSQKPSREEILSSCAEIGPEDGLDPRDFLRKESAGVPNRKALQLCKQVARTLNGILNGECSDAVLRDLIVESVLPAPNSSRLLVTVALPNQAAAIDSAQVLKHLAAAHGLLRAGVAAAIHRKRVPELSFQVRS